MVIVPNFAGTSANEVAVLLRDPVTGAIHVRVKDLSSGVQHTLIWYSDTFYPVELEVVSDFGGTSAPEIALLARDKNAPTHNRVLIKDASSGALLRQLFVHNSFVSIDIEVVSDFAGTAAPEMAVLSRRCGDKIVRVDTFDCSSGVVLSSNFFTEDQVPLDLEVLPNIGGVSGTAADELVLLSRRASDNLVNVKVKDVSNGVVLRDIYYEARTEPLDIEIMDNFAGTAAGEIALLGRNPSNGFVDVKIKDGSSGIWIDQLVFADTRLAYDLGILEDMNGGGHQEVAVMTVQVSDSERLLPIKDALDTLVLRITIP